jgi:hypothetical protein
MWYLTKKIGPFADQDWQEFDDLVKQFECLNNLPGLGINENERIAIVSALNMKKGHWYVCPNGHPYVQGRRERGGWGRVPPSCFENFDRSFLPKLEKMS